jgi:hypothetical protein
MDDGYQSFDSPADDQGGNRPRRLPVKLNVQTVATAVLVVALVIVVYLFFASPPDTSTTLVLPTATAQFRLLPATAGTPGAETVSPSASVVPGAAGTSALGTAAAPVLSTAALGTAVTPMGALGAQTPGTPVAMAPAGAIGIGAFVRVGGTEGMGIRYRFGPGTDYATVRIVMDNETLKVLGGPETASAETWWRLQDQYGNIGWAAQGYLQPAAAPAAWAPPAASPTVSADAAQLAAPSATP